MTDPVATIQLGDCRDIIAELPDCSVDSIVTDPPYELGFMGKRWDATGIAYDVELWRQCLRVLKPGGHLLAFGGTRTYHRMAVAIEDAGFEIRDSIHWLYGTGFPKSLDVSKAIDKQRDDRAEVLAVTAWVRAMRDAAGITNRDIDDAFGFAGMSGHWTSSASQPAVPTLDQVPTLLNVLGVNADDVPADIRRLLWDLNGKKGQPGENWAKREVVGATVSTTLEVAPGEGRERPQVVVDITAPATDAARQWEGWGTALKPAHEPIVVARKPLTGTVAATVLEHGTGALNIDGCRVGSDVIRSSGEGIKSGSNNYIGGGKDKQPPSTHTGRWPANLVITHHADCGDQCATGCPVAELDRQSGNSVSPPVGSVARVRRPASQHTVSLPPMTHANGYGDSGGASRFFAVTEWDQIADTVPFRYVAKPSRAERDAGLGELPEQPGGSMSGGEDPRPDRPTNHPMVRNHHPTVKPIALMRWLVRLVTPPGGTVLEPFAGSGTTMAAAILEDFHVIGCELTADYLPIIKNRIAWAQQTRDITPPTLFDQAHSDD